MLARLYCYSQGVLTVFEVPQHQATKKQRELSRQGYVVTHTELV